MDDESYPIVVEKQGIKIKEEKMETEKLYYCLYDEKLYLLFKDVQGSLNCYEVEDKGILEKVKSMESNKQIEKLLEELAKQQENNDDSESNETSSIK